MTTINKNMVPFDDKSPFITSGIQPGLPALTTRGLMEEHMELIADWIDKIQFMRGFVLYPGGLFSRRFLVVS